MGSSVWTAWGCHGRIDAAKEAFAAEAGNKQQQQQQDVSFKDLETQALTPKGSKKTMNHLATLSAKPVLVKDVVPSDFFGSQIKVDPSKQVKKVESDLVKSDIWFKFKEGYSNAVRRNVKMK